METIINDLSQNGLLFGNYFKEINSIKYGCLLAGTSILTPGQKLMLERAANMDKEVLRQHGIATSMTMDEGWPTLTLEKDQSVLYMMRQLDELSTHKAGNIFSIKVQSHEGQNTKFMTLTKANIPGLISWLLKQMANPSFDFNNCYGVVPESVKNL